MKDGSGRVLSNGSEVCDRWKEYFDGLLNVSESGRAEITARPGMNVRMFEKADAEISTLLKILPIINGNYWQQKMPALPYNIQNGYAAIK